VHSYFPLYACTVAHNAQPSIADSEPEDNIMYHKSTFTGAGWQMNTPAPNSPDRSRHANITLMIQCTIFVLSIYFRKGLRTMR